MKTTYKVFSLVIPWYLKPITVINCNKMEAEIGIFSTIKTELKYLWFLVPRKIRDYNLRNCVNYIPDVVNFDGTLGVKIQPIFGYYLKIPENSLIKWRWWEHLLRVK